MVTKTKTKIQDSVQCRPRSLDRPKWCWLVVFIVSKCIVYVTRRLPSFDQSEVRLPTAVQILGSRQNMMLVVTLLPQKNDEYKILT